MEARCLRDDLQKYEKTIWSLLYAETVWLSPYHFFLAFFFSEIK